jgi:hypothetical protein
VADDIVARLRANADWIAQAFAVLHGTAELGQEAADEIELLRAELAQARETIIDSEARNMAYAWREARRG